MDYATGKTWASLRRAWRAYRIAKVQHDTERMKKAAVSIRKNQEKLGVPLAIFPEVHLISPERSKEEKML